MQCSYAGDPHSLFHIAQNAQNAQYRTYSTYRTLHNQKLILENIFLAKKRPMHIYRPMHVCPPIYVSVCLSVYSMIFLD